MSVNSTKPDTVLGAIRYQLRTLSDSVALNDQRKKRQWQDDAEVLEAYVSALSATKTVLKEEQNRVLAKIEPLKKRKGRKTESTNAHSSNFLSKDEVQERLGEFRRRVKEAEVRVEQAMDNLSTAVRTEERSMLEDQIAIMGETRKLCLEEAQLLEVMLKQMEVAEQQRKEQEADWKELGHLKDQLTKLEAKIDQAKRCLLFPSVHGYRFRVGTGGIYIGAKDLYVSDLSASFSLSVESVRQSEKTAVIRMNMGGRDVRPSTLSIAEDISYGDAMDVISASANEINNNPPHVPSDLHDPCATTNEAGGNVVSNGDAESDDASLAHSSEAPDAKDDSHELQTEKHSIEPSSPPQLHPLMTSHTNAQPPSSISTGPTEEFTQKSEEQGVESESEAVVQSLQGTTPGKNLAMKFLTRIADKSHLPRGVARASQALFFTAPPPVKPQAHPAAHSALLLNKFDLASDAPPATRPVQPRTRLHYKAESEAPTAVALHKSGTSAAELPADADIAKAAANSVPHVMPSENGAAPMKEVSKTAASDIFVPSHAVHRPALSNASTMDRSYFFSRRAPSLFENSSEGQSDTTSLVGAGHKGVHVKLQGAHVSVIAEKGTRVPNMTVRDITLEVECSLSVAFEYSLQHGWQSRDGLKFEVLQLRKKTVGNSIPMPAGLIKTLLNLILPRIVERALLSALPQELGTYVLESEKGMTAAGEIAAVGPPLSTLEAQLNTVSPYEKSRSYASDLKAYSAVQEAQNLLSLSSNEAMLLGECFSTSGPFGLLEGADGWRGVCSIKELCRFYDKYSSCEIWLALCDLWNKAIQHVSEAKGVPCTVNFGALMNGAVARLAAKPVRTQCHFTRLNCQLNVDAFLLALRDYCERSARELYEEKPLAVTVPLDEQLQALHEWYSATKTRLVHFKSNFKSAMASIVAKADARNLQIGLEGASYEGPLRFQVPVVRDDQEPGMLSFDVSIPAPGSSNSTQFIDSLSRALSGAESDGSEERRLEWGVGSSTQELLDKILQQPSDPDDPNQDQQSLPLGKAFLQSLRASMALNADYLSQQLFNGLHHTSLTHPSPPISSLGAGMSSITQLKSYLETLGDVVVGDLSPASNQAPDKYTLTFQSNHFARFKCLADTLGFQSTVSPAEIFSMLHICAREYLSTFCKEDLNRLRATDRLFKHIIRYVDKRSLDVVVCSKLTSTVTDSKLVVSLSELDGGASENGPRYPIHFTNDLDLSLLMDTLTFAQGKLEA